MAVNFESEIYVDVGELLAQQLRLLMLAYAKSSSALCNLCASQTFDLLDWIRLNLDEDGIKEVVSVVTSEFSEIFSTSCYLDELEEFSELILQMERCNIATLLPKLIREKTKQNIKAVA